jgi:DNA-binding NarL/FixJ family response regulator
MALSPAGTRTSEAALFDEEAVRIEGLTPREREVSRLVAEGRTNKQIAQRLAITAITVRHHLTSIFRKLAISNRFELICLCFKHELVTAPGRPAGPRAAVIRPIGNPNSE